MNKLLPKLNTPKCHEKPKHPKLDVSNSSINSIYDFKRVNISDDDTDSNGLLLGGCYVYKELLDQIFSYLDANELLKLSEVCKSWHIIVRSHRVWMEKYKRDFKKRPKKLPWFVYYTLYTQEFFDVNLLRNGDASEGLRSWDMNHTNLDYRVEYVCNNYEQLPEDITHCFNTYSRRNVPICFKSQKVDLDKGLFSGVILDYYQPHIYASEYVCNTPGYNASYELRVYILTSVWKKPEEHKVVHRFNKDNNNNWVRKELTVDRYPENTRKLEYYHGSYDHDKDYEGHYGTIMTGGIVKLLFDSIQPKDDDKFILD